MTDHSPKHGEATCSTVAPWLESRIVGEPLSENERALLDAHLNSCSDCQAFSRFSTGLSVFAPESASQSSVVGVVDNLFEQRIQRRRRVGAMWVAAALMVTALGVAPFFKSEKTKVNAPSIDVAAAKCTPSSPTQIHPGVWMAHCQEQVPTVVIDNAGNVTIQVVAGGVGISADPERPNKAGVTVATAHGVARVKGTVFTVHQQADDTRIEVYRGAVVAISGENGEAQFVVRANSGAWLLAQTRYPLPGKEENVLSAPSLAVAYSPYVVGAQDERRVQVADAVDGTGRGVTEVADAEDGDLAQGDSPARRRISKERAKVQVPALDLLIGEARQCMVRKHWQCAATNYESILTHYDKRWEAMSALISLARIELRHLGRPVQARQHFTAYKERNSNGPLIAEAILGMAECERRLGNSAKELKILQDFVKQHPGSSLAPKAKRRIGELTGDSH